MYDHLEENDDMTAYAVELSLETHNQEKTKKLLQKAVSSKTQQNNCLDKAFEQLYRYHFGKNFEGNVREEIRELCQINFETDNPELYELADGQQLSVDAFSVILNRYNMQVLYVRKNGNFHYLGDGNLVKNYVIYHTVGEDYNIQGDNKYAGHYEVIHVLQVAEIFYG